LIKRVDLGKGKIMKLGLALGGGAVRGLAHIGVLKVLKKQLLRSSESKHYLLYVSSIKSLKTFNFLHNSFKVITLNLAILNK